MTREEALKLLKLAWSQWPHYAIDEFTIESFFQILQARQFEECTVAVFELLKGERRNPPNAGEINSMLKIYDRRQSRALQIEKPEKPVTKETIEKFWNENETLKKLFNK